MKDKVNQMFKDKLFLVMLVLGLLTIVVAAGAVTIQRGNSNQGEEPYLENMQGSGNLLAEEQESQLSVAGDSNAAKADEERQFVSQTQAVAEGKIDEPVAEVGAGKENAASLVLNFTDTSKMMWPAKGNVILDFSMESTIYFPTLDQYKCNPGIVIQSDVSTPVYAPANARILEIGSNEELGNFVVLDLGNEYVATCGQLKELQVVENEYLEQGQIMGYVAEPTKYYSVEGTNVFFELKHQDTVIDPLDYLE
ncbi:MAG: peptidoglycan DD-metalloendopeptidase family protein [Lachnospiraceae bacterium]